jgi:hypothetical protein
MPFDVTGDRASFQIASRIGPSLGGAALQTHWVYWSADCRHLVDVFIALTDNDSVVVDPRRLQGQVQAVNPPRNHPVGPVIDVAGERGVVIVTGLAPGGSATPQLVGAWTIADPTTHPALDRRHQHRRGPPAELSQRHPRRGGRAGRRGRRPAVPVRVPRPGRGPLRRGADR